LLLDKFDTCQYNKFMDKLKITKQVFKAVEKDYKDALANRRESILIQAQNGMTQQDIADYWGLDISRINRIIRKKGSK
jgi:DNA-binding MarR family transcriptional regulator